MSADWLGNGVEGTNFAFGSMEKNEKREKKIFDLFVYIDVFKVFVNVQK